MRLLKNEDLYSRQIRNITSAETSNIAMVVQTPQVFPHYFSVNADLSTNVNGFQNVHDYIGPHSSVMFDKIEKMPMSGVENLVMQNEWDDELGTDVNFTSQATIYPNTIEPKPGDVFYFPESVVPAIYIVTNVTNTVVRSNPFVEISFRLYTQSKQDLAQLERQVHDVYRVTVSAIGTDRTLLIKNTAYFEIKDHIKSYIDIANFYVSTFYDRVRAAFIYGDLYDSDKDVRFFVIDLMLWKLMYERGIIVYDPVINYGLNNYDVDFDRVYVDRPLVVNDHEYSTSIFARLLTRNRKSPFFEKRFPTAYTEDTHITKYHGANLLYIEEYSKKRNCNPAVGNFTVFDDEFVDRILHDRPYDITDIRVNTSLRNAVILYFNDHDVDFEKLYIRDEKSIENYYLVPMVLDMYKQKIASMQTI